MKKLLSMVLAVALVLLASFFGLTGGEEAADITLSQQIQVLPEETFAATEAVPETEAQPQAPPETEALLAADGG